jgi:flagella basal body P-ring formation protein FlgA
MSLAALIVLGASTAALSLSVPATDSAPAQRNERVEDLLREQLQQRYPAVQRWEIRRFGGSGGSSVAAATDGDEAQVVRLGTRSAVRFGKRLHWYTVAGFQNVISAKHRVAAGERIDASVGQIEERDVLAAAGCEPLADASLLNGMRARTSLRADEIICERSIEPQPIVARGDAVTVRYVGERVVLITKGIAQEDGNVGDTLSVQSPKSAGAFKARVSGAGEVTIHE